MNTSAVNRERLDEGGDSHVRDLVRKATGIRHILVCLDQSRLAEAALPYAIFLANAFHASITLLHVMQQPHNRPGRNTPDTLVWEIDRQDATSYLERLRMDMSSATGQPVTTRVEQGYAPARIRAAVRELGADITVLGACGEAGPSAWTLGSTAQQVLVRAERSVLVARATGAQSRAFAPKRILVPLDGSPRAESVLPTANRIARATGAEIVLAHVVSEPLPSSVLYATEDVVMARELASHLESRARRYLEHISETLSRERLSVRALVSRHADPGQCLCDLVDSENIGFVLLSAHGSTCNRGRSFGGVATHLLTYLAAPAMVLQDLAESDFAHVADAGVDTPRSLSALASREWR